LRCKSSLFFMKIKFYNNKIQFKRITELPLKEGGPVKSFSPKTIRLLKPLGVKLYTPITLTSLPPKYHKLVN